MSEQNPYTPPRALVGGSGGGGPWELAQPRRLPGGHGWGWIREGFALFGRSPGLWIVIYLLFGLISTVLSMLPLVSIGTYVLSPIFIGGLMLGCRRLDEGDRLEVADLFAGFTANGGKLAGVGGLFLGGLLLIGAAVMMIVLPTAVLPALEQMGHGPPPPFAIMGVLIAVSVSLLLLVPLLMAVWLAPALVVFHDVDIMDSLTQSFKASARNAWPLTVYGLAMLALTFLGALPLLLGLLVIGPLTFTSTYAAYKDIFVDASGE